MQRTIAAVFDKQNQAEQAMNDLVASGFSRDSLLLSQKGSDEQTAQAKEGQSSGSEVRAFFNNIFGTASHPDAQLYSDAVMYGNYVLTLDVLDDDQVDRATDILERHHPVDIDEEARKWKSGWSAPEPMMQSAAAEQQSQSGTTAIPVIQEELKVGKRVVQRGGVRIVRRVLETPVQETVDLNEDRVTVERHAVDQPASPADLAAFEEGSFEVRETAEEPVVEKVARVVEEVIVGKQQTQRQEQVTDKVRSTEVEVEQLSGQARQSVSADDDAYFRTHWTSNYANLGGSYEEYVPAYRYGSTSAGSDRYKGQQWNDIEADVRRDWESQNSGSDWAKMKNAVRHGWERMTS